MEVQAGAAQDMECQEEGQGVEQGEQDSHKQQQDKTSPGQGKWPSIAQRGTCSLQY